MGPTPTVLLLDQASLPVRCCFLKLTLIERKGRDIVTRDDKTDRFVSACGMQNLKLTNENMGNMNGILKCSVFGDL